MPKLYRYLVPFIFLIFLIFWAVGWYWNLQVHQAKTPEAAETSKFVIQTGESGRVVGKRLADQEIIKSPLFFRLYLRSQNSQGTHIQAGEYQLGSNMSIAEIVNTISAAGSFESRITFAEGWRVEEMALEVNDQFSSSNFQIKAEKFLQLGKEYQGYLFPDTYFVDQQTTAADLIDKMRANFDTKYQEVATGVQSEGLTQEEAVVFASIVEREAAQEEDRRKVAGILIKRWRNGWPLEADATVQFAIANMNCQIQDPTQLYNGSPRRMAVAKFDPAIRRVATSSESGEIRNLEGCDFWPKKLTEEDLKTESPYNTRKNVGLPPTPIANPGLATLKAVTDPQESPYWYYLTDETGTTHYATTLQEHNANIDRYLR